MNATDISAAIPRLLAMVMKEICLDGSHTLPSSHQTATPRNLYPSTQERVRRRFMQSGIALVKDT
jgi:hypothetical protein